MDEGYEDYVRFLKENIDQIRSSLIMDRKDFNQAVPEWFSEIYHEYVPENQIFSSISASDSSEFVRELYNGKKIIMTRGYSVKGGKSYSQFFSDVFWVSRDHLRSLVTMLMENVEHISVCKMLKKESPDLVLLDGSLTGRLYHGYKRFESEKYADLADAYYDNLNEMLLSSSKTGSAIVYISKTSESRLLVSQFLKEHRASLPSSDIKKLEATVDHVIVKSLAVSPGYTEPIRVENSFIDDRSIWSFNILPSIQDLPVKVEVVTESELDRTFFYKLLDTLYWGYCGAKVHNIWISNADNMVKFRTDEVERIYMATFERIIGIPFYETRGKRRARIRI